MVKKNEIEDPRRTRSRIRSLSRMTRRNGAGRRSRSRTCQRRTRAASRVQGLGLGLPARSRDRGAFEKVGYTGKLAKLWAALNPEGEATAEDMKAFAAEYGVTPARPEGYTPTIIGSEASAMPAKTYTRAEMEEIARTNPARAQALAEQGRVVWNNPQQIEGRPRR